VTEEHHALAITTNEHRDIDTTVTITMEADTEQQDDTTRKSPSPDVTVNHDISQNSFSMPLANVTNYVARNDLTYHEPVLMPVQNLDVSSIAADPNVTVHPTLRKEMDFMQT